MEKYSEGEIIRLTKLKSKIESEKMGLEIKIHQIEELIIAHKNVIEKRRNENEK